jgi:hypothetical protein
MTWVEQRYSHVHNVPDNTEVRCGCGRLEWASMMQDVRPIPVGKRAAHHDEAFACTHCVSHAYELGFYYPDEHRAALGADEAAMVAARHHTALLKERHAALAQRWATSGLPAAILLGQLQARHPGMSPAKLALVKG